MSKTLIIGDPHAPFVDRSLFQAIGKFCKEQRPSQAVIVGDISDQYNWSRYSKDPRAMGPSDEWNAFVDCTKWMRKLIGEKLETHILIGNHDLRIFRSLSDLRIPGQIIKGLDEIIQFPNWHWHTGNAPLIIGGVAFVHGHEDAGSALDKAKIIGMPVVQGHDHRGSIEYLSTAFNKTIWGMSVGTTVDKESLAVQYGAKNLRKSFQGWGWIENDIPYLFPWK